MKNKQLATKTSNITSGITKRSLFSQVNYTNAHSLSTLSDEATET